MCDLTRESRGENFCWWRSWLADIVASCVTLPCFSHIFQGGESCPQEILQDTCCFVSWRQLTSFSLQTLVAPSFASGRKLFSVAFSWISSGLAASWFCWEPFQPSATVHTRPLGPSQLSTFQMTDWPGWEIMTTSGRSYIVTIYPTWDIIPTYPAQTSAPHPFSTPDGVTGCHRLPDLPSLGQ